MPGFNRPQGYTPAEPDCLLNPVPAWPRTLPRGRILWGGPRMWKRGVVIAANLRVTVTISDHRSECGTAGNTGCTVRPVPGTPCAPIPPQSTDRAEFSRPPVAAQTKGPRLGDTSPVKPTASGAGVREVISMTRRLGAGRAIDVMI